MVVDPELNNDTDFYFIYDSMLTRSAMEHFFRLFAKVSKQIMQNQKQKNTIYNSFMLLLYRVLILNFTLLILLSRKRLEKMENKSIKFSRRGISMDFSSTFAERILYWWLA